MLQRNANAGMGDATVFGVVLHGNSKRAIRNSTHWLITLPLYFIGFNGYVYKMIQPSAELNLLIQVGTFKLPNSMKEVAVCPQTIASFLDLKFHVLEQTKRL